ncbi:MAG: ThuA domain-containing protein [Rhodospirillales bacterium]|nr:ThuA domain-containing protein [Rhodospirillales bacterium]
MKPCLAAFVLASLATFSCTVSADEEAREVKPYIKYEGNSEGDLPGKGKHVVIITGDEEYRSEQVGPMLGRILAEHHGFDCTVLFAIDPKRGVIQPNVQTNIPGLEALEDADLAIFILRFRNLPDKQMEYIDDYLKAGKPVIGLRTSTHAFKIPADSKWAHYSFRYRGEKKEWREGFGKLVLGETWIAHHGAHNREATRGQIPDGVEGHPILRGIEDKTIWGDTDVYTIRLPLPGDSKPLVMGEVLAGMKPDSPPVEGPKNDPMMPVAWTKTYQLPGGEKGDVFTTTMGSADDLDNAPFRKLLVNASYWAVGLEERIPSQGAKVDLVGDNPTDRYGFHDNAYWIKKDARPSDVK